MNTIRTFRNALESFDSELLSPFTVGFDRTFDRLWDYANHNNATTNYPPYNVKKHENNKFVIEIALAGFSRSDLDVEVSDGILSISSVNKSAESEQDVSSLYQGIAKRQFTKRFSLADDIVVKEASIKDGMLFINLERVIPDERKPRKISIN